MMDMRFLPIGAQEERVMVYRLFSQIQMHKHRDGDSLTILLDVDKVSRYDVEGGGVELELRLKILRRKTKVTELKGRISSLYPNHAFKFWLLTL